MWLKQENSTLFLNNKLVVQFLIALFVPNSYKVAEFFHVHKRDYAKVLRCHLLDEDLQRTVFEFITGLIKGDKLTKQEKDTVRNTTLMNISSIVKIDSDKTIVLIAEVFTDDSDRVIGDLEQFPELQYSYLKSLLQHQSKYVTC